LSLGNPLSQGSPESKLGRGARRRVSRLKEHPFLARRAAGVKKLMPSARTVDVPNIQGIGGGAAPSIQVGYIT